MTTSTDNTPNTTPAAAIVAALATLSVHVTEEIAVQVVERMTPTTVKDAIKFDLLPHIAQTHFNAMIGEFTAAAVAKSQTLDSKARAYLADRGVDLSKTFGAKKLELYDRARAAVLAMENPPPSEGEKALASYRAKQAPGLLDLLAVANGASRDETGGNPPVTGTRKVAAAELPGNGANLTPMQKLSAANSLTGAVPKLLREIHTKQAKLALMPPGLDQIQTASYVDSLKRQLLVHGVKAA